MIQVFKPHIGFSDIISVLKTMMANNISGTSPVVKDFETKLANKFDREYAVAVSNGSVALDLAFQALGLEEGDEVIVPSFTIISCLSAIIRSNAKPVFCDVDHQSWNMTLENIKDKYTSNTKAILMVHTYGLPADAIKISEFCRENKIILVEDSAEAHGQSLGEINCGKFGLVSTLSFYANKHISTGEGGAILTDSEEIYLQLMQMRNLDFIPGERFNHNNLFWNYRLGGLQAALGISQINKIDKVIKSKKIQGRYYIELLQDHTDKIQLPLVENYGSQNHFWVFGIVLKKQNIRNKVMKSLEKKNIETRPFFWPLHLQNYIKNKFSRRNENLEHSENLGKNGLYLPLGPHVNKKMQKKIVEELIESINKT